MMIAFYTISMTLIIVSAFVLLAALTLPKESK